MNRRGFLTASLATGTVLAHAQASVANEPALPDFKGRTRADLPTPCLVLDLDAFEANLRTMADHCRKAGCGFRPHAKTHKCPEIARRQIASGALGVCVATMPEAEAMVAAGIRGVLLTSPIMDTGKVARAIALYQKGTGFLLSLGHAREVELLSQAAQKAKVNCDVLIDLDVGDRRTGILPGEPALELARLIGKQANLRLRGLQAYAGHASHVIGFEQRQKTSRQAMAQAVATRELLAKAGIKLDMLSGGSTGTYNIDSGISGVTELQVGSYVFMDVDYRRIGGQKDQVYIDFRPSLTVLSTVVSASHADRVTVDAGTKALDTTVPFPAEVKEQTGLTYRRAGDEFGTLLAAKGTRLPRIGDRVEFIVPHCDPTTNLYDRLYAMRGNQVEAVWRIVARRE